LASGYWQSSFFTKNLPAKLSTASWAAVSNIDNILRDSPDLGTAFSKLTEFITVIDAVIGKLTLKEEMRQYPEIMRTCKDVKVELQNRKQRIIRPTKEDKGAAQIRIQWLGQVNVIGTLFYHLLKGQDGGAPYISASVEQVKRMLVENFVDNEGHELSKGTLDTIFTPSRSEKRANEGDRIELPNKKVKK
jgi:hypothetical protein